MAELDMQVGRDADSINGQPSLEARLRCLFAEQHRLRDLLEQTRAELDQVNREVLQVQDEYCTDAARQEEYDNAIERILGFDPRIDLQEVADILDGKRSCDMKEFIEELEGAVQATPSQGAP